MSNSKKLLYGQKADLAPNEDYYDIYIGGKLRRSFRNGAKRKGRTELPGLCAKRPDWRQRFLQAEPDATPNQLPGSGSRDRAVQDRSSRRIHRADVLRPRDGERIFSRPFGPSSFHHATLNPSVTTTISSLTVETTDFLLFDETNGVTSASKGTYQAAGPR